MKLAVLTGLLGLSLFHATSKAAAPSRVQVVGREYSFSLSRVRVHSGTAVIELANFGQDLHDLRVQRIGSKHVAGLGVVREDDDERSAALEEDGGEEERHERLGNAGSGRRRDELAEALALGELAGEGVECRLVHDERRNARFRGVIVAAGVGSTSWPESCYRSDFDQSSWRRSSRPMRWRASRSGGRRMRTRWRGSRRTRGGSSTGEPVWASTCG